MNALPQMKPRKAASGRVGMLRFSAVQFLIMLALFLVSAPFVEKLPNGTFIDGSLLTLVLMAGVLAVGRSHRIFIAAIILAVPVIAGRWIHLLWSQKVNDAIYLGPALVFFGFLIGNLLYYILRAQRVDSEVLCAGLSVYLLLGMVWMVAYVLVAELSPGAFVFTAGGPDSAHVMSGFTAIYFSFITLTTVGFGDVVPVSSVARMLASMEAMTGTIFMAVMVARLVSLYSAHPPGGSGETGSGEEDIRQS